jgi:hypothetical protein
MTVWHDDPAHTNTKREESMGIKKRRIDMKGMK